MAAEIYEYIYISYKKRRKRIHHELGHYIQDNREKRRTLFYFYNNLIVCRSQTCHLLLSFRADFFNSKFLNDIPQWKYFDTEKNTIFQSKEGLHLFSNCWALTLTNIKYHKLLRSFESTWLYHNKIQNIQFKYLLSSLSLYIITAFTTLPKFAPDTVQLKCWEILNRFSVDVDVPYLWIYLHISCN